MHTHTSAHTSAHTHTLIIAHTPSPPPSPPQDKKLGSLPEYQALLTTFATSEIIAWPALHARYQAEIAGQPDIFAGALGREVGGG